jgi:hypothetical protein
VSSVAAGTGFEYDVRRLTEASAVGNHTAVPCARIHPEPGTVYLATVTLGGYPEPLPLVSSEGRTIRVEWSDGQVDRLELSPS